MMKYTFMVTQTKSLGHVMDAEGIDRELEKLSVSQELLVPKNKKDVLTDVRHLWLVRAILRKNHSTAHESVCQIVQMTLVRI